MISAYTPATSRADLLSGQLAQASPSDASRALAAHARAMLTRAMPEAQDLRLAHHHIAQADFFARLTQLRAELTRDTTCQHLTRALIHTLGFDHRPVALDVVRVRAIRPDSHLIPAAAPAFWAHRDTWYANPQAQLNLWIPLFDITHAFSFGFYPDAFAQHVPNTSALFDYDAFKAQGGFQNYTSAQREAQAHPTLTDDARVGAPHTFALDADSVLLFAAHHLHQTLPNLSDLTRYSLDFRLVDRQDYAEGLGPARGDNASRGCTLSDYRW